MGLCYSIICCEPRCSKCGCPYYYYNDKEHASRQSCRRYDEYNNVEFGYHEWS